MDIRGSMQLTLFFNGQFWEGVFESRQGSAYAVVRHVFGQEPSEPEVFEFILKQFVRLSFHTIRDPQTAAAVRVPANPKRRQREAAREVRQGVGTKAQNVLKQQWELLKEERKAEHREKRSAEEERKFLLRLEKRKQKRRGR